MKPAIFINRREFKKLINLIPITEECIAQIKAWPPYGDGFEPMDYALRQGGWLDEYRGKADTWIYVALSGNETVGFSLLSTINKGEAEFRIALHPHHTGMGLGRELTIKTLKTGFRELGLNRIFLIVRKNNYPAMKVYERLGFKKVGESTHDIQGKSIEFFDMDIDRLAFSNLEEMEVK